MCHRVHVMLSAEDKKDVKKVSGILIPLYATVLLVAIAVVAIVGSPRQGELIAAAAVPASAR